MILFLRIGHTPNGKGTISMPGSMRDRTVLVKAQAQRKRGRYRDSLSKGEGKIFRFEIFEKE
jgi:hypothetical protein